MDGHRGDRVARRGRAAIDPFGFAAVAVDVSSVTVAGFARSGIQLAVVHGQCERQNRLARPAAIGPLARAIAVDAKLQLAKVSLIGRHPGIGFQGQMKSTTRFLVVLAGDIAGHVVDIRIGIHPRRDRDAAGIKPQSCRSGNFEIGIATVEPGGSPRLTAGTGHIPIDGAMHHGMSLTNRVILRIAGQRPVSQELAPPNHFSASICPPDPRLRPAMPRSATAIERPAKRFGTESSSLVVSPES